MRCAGEISHSSFSDGTMFRDEPVPVDTSRRAANNPLSQSTLSWSRIPSVSLAGRAMGTLFEILEGREVDLGVKAERHGDPSESESSETTRQHQLFRLIWIFRNISALFKNAPCIALISLIPDCLPHSGKDRHDRAVIFLDWSGVDLSSDPLHPASKLFDSNSSSKYIY